LRQTGFMRRFASKVDVGFDRPGADGIATDATLAVEKDE